MTPRNDLLVLPMITMNEMTTKHRSERDITSYIRCTRNKTKNIIDKDEEENGEQVRHIFLILATQGSPLPLRLE